MKAIFHSFMISLVSLSTALAQPVQPRVSHIAIAKSNQDRDRFVFSVCNGQKCQRLGSEVGYTEEQIEKLNGTMQMIGASALGLGEGLVVVYLGAAGVAIGAGYLSFGAMVGGGTAGVVAPLAAIKFIEPINPVKHYRRGRAKLRMERGVEQMIASGEASIVIYRSEDAKQTLRMARIIHSTLVNL